ncbi:amidohydrolase family protein [Pedobacter sp. JY14-1]|uniref:amidohydrolase family protein n=1 Tax=Pedobacter sp. JY14-1 TaxID=3034151 RepID=UPI0023E2A404|nr:amidohydrolase family protein [Pedobacter sp. JY14-1]
MISYLSASYVYPVSSPPLKNGVIGVGADGLIAEVLDSETARARGLKDVHFHEGLLVPGFVNAHCHLELSCLRGKIAKHTGLISFVQEVMRLRTADEYELDAAMLRADIEMLENGIVAVGDIANQAVSRVTKRGSLIHYHTFVEIMGFDPAMARTILDKAKELKRSFGPLPASVTPHAPYSVSEELFYGLSGMPDDEGGCISIHNQETSDENLFFQYKTGGFTELFARLGLDIGFYQASGKTSLQTYLPFIPKGKRLQLVHNTFTSREDVVFSGKLHYKLYWCLCPNANLYIENRLPDVGMMRAEGLRITLGTDSLASNDSLSIFSEMQTLQQHFKVPVEELLTWACLNGAEFLGISERYGSFEPGKRPGINLLKFNERNGGLVLGASMRRLY